MKTNAITARDPASALGRSRARVLDLLVAANGPMSVQEIADSTGLHRNTARFHLDGLVDAGLAAREPRARATPGRPSMTYRAASGGGLAAGRRYRLLAEMLSSMIAAVLPDAANASTEAGREWGAYLTEQPPPYERPGAGESIDKLLATLGGLGFACRPVADGNPYDLRMVECPFRDVARHHQDVVCSLHLGLMQGALAKMRAPVSAAGVEPFSERGCIAHLAAMPDSPGMAGPAAAWLD